MNRSIRGSNITRVGLAVALAAGWLCAQTPDSFPLLKTCSGGAETVATLHASDSVKVRFNYAGDAGNCYAVTATIGDRTVEGYLVGAGHPAITAFEKEVRSQPVRIPPAAPAAASIAPAGAGAAVKAVSVTAPAAEAAPAPLSFAGFRATAIDRWPVDLSHERAPNVFIYFWSARSRAGIRAIEAVGSIYETYHTRGVYVVGVGSAASVEQLKTAVAENELGGLQVLDRGGLAARYHVDPAKPFMVLDQSRNVIAAAPTAQDLQPILDQLTKYRRPSRP